MLFCFYQVFDAQFIGKEITEIILLLYDSSYSSLDNNIILYMLVFPGILH
jgi:hypothetical protein